MRKIFGMIVVGLVISSASQAEIFTFRDNGGYFRAINETGKEIVNVHGVDLFEVSPNLVGYLAPGGVFVVVTSKGDEIMRSRDVREFQVGSGLVGYRDGTGRVRAINMAGEEILNVSGVSRYKVGR
ncbi:MAG: hypothetical protein AB7P04_06305 [Bacteriovoracia bacterium]